MLGAGEGKFEILCATKLKRLGKHFGLSIENLKDHTILELEPHLKTQV